MSSSTMASASEEPTPLNFSARAKSSTQRHVRRRGTLCETEGRVTALVDT
jgi:hypothetical protein